jgi:hypothetical protein
MVFEAESECDSQPSGRAHDDYYYHGIILRLLQLLIMLLQLLL